MLKDEIKKKSIKKNIKKRLKLTCETHDLGHKTKITSWKVNQNKLWISILTLKGEIKKRNQFKKAHKNNLNQSAKHMTQVIRPR